MNGHKIKIRLYHAPDELHTCLVYMEEHKAVLVDFGIEMVTSNNNKWVHNPNMLVIVAESLENGDMLAGIRIQLQGGTQPLPIEIATGEKDPKIYDLIEKKAKEGITGEVCGLWNSRKYKGNGISRILITASTAVLNQFGVTSFFGLCDSSNVAVMQLYGGYDVETSIGNKGTFYYPKLDLLAYAIILKDPDTVKLARQDIKDTIFALRAKPEQRKVVQMNKRLLDLNYYLKLERKSI
ncbi:MAG: hypothetical protein JKX73_02250 [Flavobacteriales bacterium]|nr:hypothetical protein [Flavobacteriales bacterium]